MHRPFEENAKKLITSGNDANNDICSAKYISEKNSITNIFRVPQMIHNYTHHICELRREGERTNRKLHIFHHISRTIDLTLLLFFSEQKNTSRLVK